MSSSPLVLITGGDGIIEYAVRAGRLKAGVRVSSIFLQRLFILLLTSTQRPKSCPIQNVEVRLADVPTILVPMRQSVAKTPST